MDENTALQAKPAAPGPLERFRRWCDSLLTLENRLLWVTASWGLLTGVERAIIMPTLWLYFLRYFSRQAGIQYYGVTSAAFNFSILVFSPIYGFLAYRGVNSKFLIVVSNQLEVVGNIIYFLASRPWLVMVGRFVAGIGGGSEVPLYANIMRGLKSEVRTRTIVTLLLFRQFGLIVGPACTIIMHPIQFDVGKRHFDVYNLPGMFMTILWILHTFITMAIYPSTVPTQESLEEKATKEDKEEETEEEEVKEEETEEEEDMEEETEEEEDKEEETEKEEDKEEKADEKVGKEEEIDAEEDKQEEMKDEVGKEEEMEEEEGKKEEMKDEVAKQEEMKDEVGKEEEMEEEEYKEEEMEEEEYKEEEMEEEEGKEEEMEEEEYNEEEMEEEEYMEEEMDEEEEEKDELIEDKDIKEDIKSFFTTMCNTYLKAPTIALFVTIFGAYMSIMALETVLPPVAATYFGWSDLQTSSVYIVCGVTVIIVFMIIQFVTGFLQERQFLVISMIELSLVYAYLTIITFVMTRTQPTLYIPLLMLGIFGHVFGLPFAVSFCESLFIQKVPDADMERAQSIFRTVFNFAILVGPFLGGSLQDWPWYVFLIMFIQMFIGFCLVSASYKAFEPEERKQ